MNPTDGHSKKQIRLLFTSNLKLVRKLHVKMIPIYTKILQGDLIDLFCNSPENSLQVNIEYIYIFLIFQLKLNKVNWLTVSSSYHINVFPGSPKKDGWLYCYVFHLVVCYSAFISQAHWSGS